MMTNSDIHYNEVFLCFKITYGFIKSKLEDILNQDYSLNKFQIKTSFAQAAQNI